MRFLGFAFAMLLPSCAVVCPEGTSKGACAARIGATVATLGGAALILKDRADAEEVVLEVPQPAWEMDGRFQGALISPTRSIFSTHIYRMRPKTVSYGGKAYEVTGYRQLQTPLAIGWDDEGTDVTVVDHEPVTDREPVRIAAGVRSGDRVTGYLRRRVVSVEVRRAEATVIIRRGSATFGDSSAPFTNAAGELTHLATKAGGHGPNVTRIREVLLR